MKSLHRPVPAAARRAFRLSAIATAVLFAHCAAAADVSWTGAGGSSFWDVATNWDTGARPDAGQSVAIGAVPLVTFRTASGFTGATVDSIDSDAANFAMTGGTLTLSGPSSFAALTQSGGILSSTASISVGGGVWSNGSQRGAGITTFATGSTFTLGTSGAATLYADGGRILRNEGTVNASYGNGNFTLDLNSAPGATALTGAATIENAGTFNFSPIINRTATISASNGGTSDNGLDAQFSNSGTFNKGGAGTVTFYVLFANSGTVDVTLDAVNPTFGSLAFMRNSIWSAGSSLEGTGNALFGGGVASTNVFQAGSSVTAGRVTAFQGTVTIESGAVFTPSLLEIAQGNVVVMPGSTFAPVQLEMNNSGSLDLRSNDITLPNGSLISSGLIKGSGTVTFEEAVLRGARFKGAGTALFAAGHTTQFGAGQGGSLDADGGRILRNEGTVVLDSGLTNWVADFNSTRDGTEAGSARLENAGLLDMKTYLNRTITFGASNNGGADNGSAARIDNTGTLRQTGQGGVVMNLKVNNSGNIEVGAGTTLNFYVGTLDQKAGGKMTGEGTVYLQYLAGTPHYFRTGSTTDVGHMQIWGPVVIEDGAQFAGDYVFLRAVNGSSVTKVGSQSLVWSDGVLDVESKLTVQQDVPFILRGGRLNGAGTIEMINAAAATRPTLIAENGVVAPGGSLGSLAGSDWSSGTLTITGDYEQKTPAMLEIDLRYLGLALTNPLVGVDKLAVSGDATLGGVLVIEMDAAFNPQYLVGKTYTVLTSSRLFGTFNTLAAIGEWEGFGYEVSYVDSNDADNFADQVRITINGTPVPPPPPPVPEPGTWGLMLGGLGLLGWARRRSRKG